MPRSTGGRSSLLEIFGDVERERGDACRLPSIDPVAREEVAIVLDRRAAARRGGEDRVEPLAVDLVDPGVDVGAGEAARLALAPHVVDDRAATSFAAREHHLDAEAAEEPHCRDVDPRIEDGLCAAVEQRHPARRSPSGVKLTPGRMLVFAGRLSGARLSIVSRRVPARPNLRSIGTNGRASLAIRSARRNRRR